MKLCFLTLLIGSLAVAQSITNTSTTDINGRPIQASSAASGGERTELSRSVNGHQVPLEKTEEKVLRDDGNGKVTEKIIRKYDPNGQLSSTERVLTTEQKLSDGGSKVYAVTSRSNINGQLQEAERKTTETHQQGAVMRAETVTELPTINGSFQTAEKRNTVTEAANGTAHSEETVYQRSENGDFYQRLRQVTDERKTGDQTVIQTAAYEPAGATGSLQLARQTVSTTTKRSDGSESTEVNLYARAADGRVQENGAPLQIKEQQIISRDKGPGNAVVETLSVRRPSVSEPTRLGGLQKLSETVCTGKCAPDAK